MSDPTLSALALPLKLFVKAVLTRTRQLHAERQAGQASFQGPTNFMDRILNETLISNGQQRYPIGFGAV